MMGFKLYDYKCKMCGYVFEELSDQTSIVYCKKCGGYTKRLISVPRVNTSNQDAEWIRSVREVVDKEGGKASQEFLNHPTRDNYYKWMKEEQIRPFEKGESIKSPPPDMDKIVNETVEAVSYTHLTLPTN